MNGIGGSYRVEKGKAKLVQRTQEHPDGNRPRAEDGTPLDGVPTPPTPPAPAPAAAPQEV